ncbi:hypothetical protein [Clostridium butyricum]|uniref:Uncharacterized protein n=1 Tax=Clostridium butyricum TaxID=1492 RepID=A0A2S7FEX7_CLOBU|nr:hypothetical protein [Clostridium butyricum]KHD14450.1 hypothetical protein OA81_15535 [Clostridium butyricum]PPV17724.1 hypothetical protein AWN73_06895 [Clostridium butyricum]
MDLIKNIIFNVKENRNMYIADVLKDYDYYIKQCESFIENSNDESYKKIMIMNLAKVQGRIGEFKKAENTIKILDAYELTDKEKLIHNMNLLSLSINSNNEKEADRIFNESKEIMERTYERSASYIELMRLEYYNFKGRYDKSSEILRSGKISTIKNDYFKLLEAEVYFNTERMNDGRTIINNLYKIYDSKSPYIKKKIDFLEHTYVGIINHDNEKREKKSFHKKMWDNCRHSKVKRIIIFAYIDFIKLAKNKWVKFFVIPLLLTIVLCKIFNIFTKTTVLAHIISTVFMIYTFVLIAKTVLKKSKKWFILGAVPIGLRITSNIIIQLFYEVPYKIVINRMIEEVLFDYFIVIAGIVFFKSFIKNKKYIKAVLCLICAAIYVGSNIMFFSELQLSMSPKSQIESFKYAITKTGLEESGDINRITDKRGDNISYVEITINDKEFRVYENEESYYYLRDTLKKGDNVMIRYIPYANSIIQIKKTEIL